MGASEVIGIVSIVLAVIVPTFGGMAGVIMWMSKRNTEQVSQKIDDLSKALVDLTTVSRVSAKTVEIMEKTLLTHSEYHTQHFHEISLLDHRNTAIETACAIYHKGDRK